MTRILIRLLLCIAMLPAAGCSTYDRNFAWAARADVKHLLYEGAYSGRWSSSRNSAQGGKLRCILTRVNDTDFRADFHATWHGLSSTHSVVLHTKPSAPRKSGGGALDFAGTSKLHTLIGAGTYSCEGRMDSRQMRASYDATYDQGTFELARVASTNALR